MERLIQLDNLNRQEALRYLGSGGQTPDDAFMALMKDCEKTVLAQARPRYVYRSFDIRESTLYSWRLAACRVVAKKRNMMIGNM